MGGMTTSNMYLNHPDAFSYYGIWSYANANIEGKEDMLVSKQHKTNLMLAAGTWDFGLAPVNNLGAGLDDLGIEYDYLQVPAAHDWECWQLIYAYAAENFFWKGEYDNFTGLRYVDGAWRYFVDGEINTTYTGLVKYNYSLWYVRDGVLDLSFTGRVQYEGRWWYVRNGHAVFMLMFPVKVPGFGFATGNSRNSSVCYFK